MPQTAATNFVPVIIAAALVSAGESQSQLGALSSTATGSIARTTAAHATRTAAAVRPGPVWLGGGWSLSGRSRNAPVQGPMSMFDLAHDSFDQLLDLVVRNER
jgi:hypothetical protein